MDLLDRAQETEEQYRRQAVADQLGKQSAATPSRIYCLDCEEKIPEARRKHVPGCLRCVDCQQEFERGA